MEEEKDFSLGCFARYSLKRWFTILLCLVLGAIVGSLYVVSYKTTNFEAWERSIYFDQTAYLEKVSSSASLTEGDYNKFSTEVYRAKKLMSLNDQVLKMEAFDAVKTNELFYPDEREARGKMAAFFKAFTVVEKDNSLVVRYVYDVKSDDKTEARQAMVRAAVNAYVEGVIEQVKGDATFSGYVAADEVGKVIKPASDASRVFVDAEEDKTFESNERPGLVSSLAIGMVLGLVIAVLIVLVRYLFGKDVKSVKELLPRDKSQTITICGDEGDYLKLAAKLNVAGVKRPLLAAVTDDGFCREFAKGFVEFCKAAGYDVELVVFGEGDCDCHEYFVSHATDEKSTLFVYDGGDDGVIEYATAHADGFCVLLNQSVAEKKKFLSAVDSGNNAKYVCTVVYNPSENWLG